MSKKKLQKMVLWTCEKWTEKKCNSEYPCQMMLPKHATINTKTCPILLKGDWMVVPVTNLTV